MDKSEIDRLRKEAKERYPKGSFGHLVLKINNPELLEDQE